MKQLYLKWKGKSCKSIKFIIFLPGFKHAVLLFHILFIVDVVVDSVHNPFEKGKHNTYNILLCI
jgi:hypothetical protein